MCKSPVEYVRPVVYLVSVQKEQLETNLKEETMVAKRRVFDAIGTQNIAEMVTDEMIKATYGANARYKAALEEQRKVDLEKEKEDAMKKRKVVELIEAKEKEKEAEVSFLNAKRKRKLLEDSL